MKTLLLVAGSVALAAAGFAVGLAVSGSQGDVESAAPAETEVVFRNSYGEPRSVTASEAAARIEQLEREVAAVRRRRHDADDEAAPAPPPESDPPPAARFAKPDGTPYAPEELAELARAAPDVAMRRAAIRELRRADSDSARSALRAILADPESPPVLREEAAKALAQQPNRDKLPPEDLVAALRAETDPAVRRALAEGVSRMKEREAWMGDIAAFVHAEKDPDVRKFLFEAVLRDVRDPAARAELVGVAADAAASIDERRAAMAALRGRSEPETVALAASLLADRDPRIRESAVAIAGASKTISTSALAAALSDDDPGVRRAALEQGLQRLPQFANDKSLPRAEVEALTAKAVALAASDPEAAVRRAAIQGVGSLPKDQREPVLAAGREDSDLFVKLTSYARSPEATARQGTPYFVTGLESPDVAVRDFAYRQLQRLAGVTAPFDARWNAKARAEAIGRIRQDVAAAPSR